MVNGFCWGKVKLGYDYKCCVEGRNSIYGVSKSRFTVHIEMDMQLMIITIALLIKNMSQCSLPILPTLYSGNNRIYLRHYHLYVWP